MDQLLLFETDEDKAFQLVDDAIRKKRPEFADFPELNRRLAINIVTMIHEKNMKEIAEITGITMAKAYELDRTSPGIECRHMVIDVFDMFEKDKRILKEREKCFRRAS